jgi:hypothetical protein
LHHHVLLQVAHLLLWVGDLRGLEILHLFLNRLRLLRRSHLVLVLEVVSHHLVRHVVLELTAFHLHLHLHLELVHVHLLR